MQELPTERVLLDPSEAATISISTVRLEFERYELLRELGMGGMGIVWLAKDRTLDALVALKMLRKEMTLEQSALQVLKSEVIINRSLSHPNIVKTFDFVTDGRSSAISMEYINGTNLHRLKAARPEGCFEADEIGRWIGQLCGAMDYAHRQRIIHRDIKPANLLVDEKGELKVGDFGIGRTVTETAAWLTRNSSGTPPFMSPQQTMGEKAEATDDIYAIGATVYDLLTGEPPFFQGAIREQALAKVAPAMTARRKELGRGRRPIPPAWERAVAAALSKESAGRPASAAELQSAFEGKAQPVFLTPRKNARAWRWAALVLAGIGLAATAYWQRARLVPASAEHASLPPTSAFAPAPAARPPVRLAAPPAKSALDSLLQSGQISADEGDLLARALAGQQGDFERGLADRVIHQHTLSPGEWRNFSALAAPLNPIVAKLRPLFTAGIIREREFGWLSDSLAGTKGEAEAELAARLVDARELTPAQWRAQTALYPKPPVDPVVEKVKPWFSGGIITQAEKAWLEASLRAGKGDAEKGRAERLLDEKSLTISQWRAATALAYPATPDLLADPRQWPPAIDLPLGPNAVLRLLRVNPGTFLRGTPPAEKGRRSNEPSPASVRIERPFFLGVFEVTQAQYTSVIPRSPSYWRGHPEWPIDQVDWQSLTGPGGFLERVNRGLRGRFGRAVVADLPTDDEWEYACRAGSNGSFYQGGAISDLEHDSQLDRLANYSRSDAGSPQPVGSYLSNDWGFYDMLGNVAEWCRNRSIRGGSWQSNAAGCRIGWRAQSNRDADSDPSPTMGFRLLLRAGGP